LHKTPLRDVEYEAAERVDLPAVRHV
jgi:hypothetical protein